MRRWRSWPSGASRPARRGAARPVGASRDSMSTHRAAAIDCGTNSIRLLIADVDHAAGTAMDVVREMVVVRLGEGVDSTGTFAPAALERTFAACADYADLLRDAGQPSRCGSSPRRPPGTCPTGRSSSPGSRGSWAWSREVISGEEEGALSFAGATDGHPGRRAGAVPGRRHRRGIHGVRARVRAPDPPDQRGHRVRADDRASPGRGPADARAGRGGHRRHRRRDRPGRRGRPVRAGGHARRARRFGDDRRRPRAGPAGVRRVLSSTTAGSPPPTSGASATSCWR